MMADLALLPALVPAVARRRSMSASVKPAPKAPTCRNPRRLMPSQKRWPLPQNVNIRLAPLYKEHRTYLGELPTMVHGRPRGLQFNLTEIRPRGYLLAF